MVLLTDRALARFAAHGSVNAVGLRVMEARTARRNGEAGADAIVWSPSEHFAIRRLGGMAVSASATDNEAYYDQAVTPREVLYDRAPMPHARVAWRALEG